MTITTQPVGLTPSVPLDVLEALLAEHLGEPTTRIIDYSSTLIPHLGTNDSSIFFRVDLSWARAGRAAGAGQANWILKYWQAGGVRDSALGIAEPREALAWERGWLRPTVLPPGMRTPYIGAWRAPNNRAAWLAMADVTADLAAYTRMNLSGDQALGYTRAILARLAQLHALWQQPARQAELRACPWLRRPEATLWAMAPTYARALGRAPAAQVPPGTDAPAVWDGLAADLAAFLEARPADERRLWEELLTDRRPLAAGLATTPPTLLHNDLDDRNIGLRWPSHSTAIEVLQGAPEVLFIDWEWIGLGPAALDVANIIQRLPVLIRPGTPVPAAARIDELADHYFACYRTAGGQSIDPAEWRRSYGLATIAQGLAQMPHMHGRLRRTLHGEVAAPGIVGVSDAVMAEILGAGLPIMRQMEEHVLGAMQRWLR